MSFQMFGRVTFPVNLRCATSLEFSKVIPWFHDKRCLEVPRSHWVFHIRGAKALLLGFCPHV